MNRTVNRFYSQSFSASLWIFTLFILSACQPSDENLLVGKWQSDQDWYEYRADHTYDGGKSVVTLVKNFKYSIDPKAHELNMYTDDKNRTYYLIYEFAGTDTLLVRNRMSSNETMVAFYRVKN
ncbi:MAG: hypothetical protein JNJ58_00995 [Chitinophagaceae bacterium]|nr:hypothetical protein [Chitinophagaceae bacterium]